MPSTKVRRTPCTILVWFWFLFGDSISTNQSAPWSLSRLHHTCYIIDLEAQISSNLQWFLCVIRCILKVNPSRIEYPASTWLSAIINVACPPKMVSSSFQPATATWREVRALTPYHVWRLLVLSPLARSQGNVLRAERTETDRYLPHARLPPRPRSGERPPHFQAAAAQGRPPSPSSVPAGECRRQHLSSLPPGKASLPAAHLAEGNRQQATRGSSSLLRLNGERSPRQAGRCTCYHRCHRRRRMCLRM